MKYRKVTAILRCSALEGVEKALLRQGVKGVSITQVQGYGEYHNFYQPDLMCKHARVEIFCEDSEAKDIARCLMDAAHTGESGDGLVAILPVEDVFKVRTKTSMA